METFEDRKTQVRSEVNTRLDALEDLFTHELTQKLLECGLRTN